MHDLTSLHIEHASSTLRDAGALDVDLYERKLRQNAPNHAQVINHLSEARVALMFLDNGAQVTMRDSPDLRIEWFGEMFYAEVKHFRRKEQDDRYYKEMSAVALKKKHQYVADALNILVIDSSSDSMVPADAMARSAMKEYDDELCKTPHELALRRLNGIMLITSWGPVGWNSRNVAFAMAQYAFSLPRSWRLFQALDSIHRG